MSATSGLQSFHAIIPAGGAGTRLWPLSRSDKPKFLLELTGSGRTLIQQTWDRLVPLVGADHIHVVAGPAHAAAIAEQLPDLVHLIVEPSPRDSMPAIGLAAALIEKEYPGAIVGSFAADHVIADTVQFSADVTRAVRVAETGKVCTIGITPTGPSTAFGYIESGAELGIDGAPDARSARRFVEKPDVTTAAAYAESGNFSWNAGMFIVRAETLLDHLATLQPDLHDGLRTIASAWDKPRRQQVLETAWPKLTRIAIDHAIAEPVADQGGVAVVPGRFDWSDLGDFKALAELHGSDHDDETVLIDADGLVIAGDGKAVSVLGISGVIVVDTPDALLVTTMEHAQRVKEVPAAWKQRTRDDLV